MIVKKGIFITVEGIDGSGKSEALNYVKEKLSLSYPNLLFTREPGVVK